MSYLVPSWALCSLSLSAFTFTSAALLLYASLERCVLRRAERCFSNAASGLSSLSVLSALNFDWMLSSISAGGVCRVFVSTDTTTATMPPSVSAAASSLSSVKYFFSNYTRVTVTVVPFSLCSSFLSSLGVHVLFLAVLLSSITSLSTVDRVRTIGRTTKMSVLRRDTLQESPARLPHHPCGPKMPANAPINQWTK